MRLRQIEDETKPLSEPNYNPKAILLLPAKGAALPNDLHRNNQFMLMFLPNQRAAGTARQAVEDF